MVFYTRNVHYSDDVKSPQNIHQKPAMKSLSLADHRRTKLTKMHLQIPLCWTQGFDNYLHFSTEQRGLNLLTHPKSQFGGSICFFVPGGSFTSTDWQWHCCCCWTATWMKIVNKNHLFCWQRNCSTLNVHWHSANLRFLSAWILPASSTGQGLFQRPQGHVSLDKTTLRNKKDAN